MSVFSDGGSELQDLFFETAQELLQALNEEGLSLEKHPEDKETIRNIRRTVHTLKGDSAACGFRELSELAHTIEDVLAPELAARSDGAMAQLVLSAADYFDSLLSAYRAQVQLPSDEPIRALISQLQTGEVVAPVAKFAPCFRWSEYERLVIEQGSGGLPLLNLAVELDPRCAMPAASVQLVRNVLHECGRVLVIHPEEVGAPAQSVEAVLATDRPEEWVAGRCKIPSVTARVIVEEYEDPAGDHSAVPSPDSLAAAEPGDDSPGSGVDADNAEANDVEPFPSDDPLGLAAVEDCGEGAQTGGAIESGPVTTVPIPDSEHVGGRSTAARPSVAAENILRVDAERIDTVLNLVGELIIGKSMLSQAFSEFSKRFPKDPLRHRFADLLAHQVHVLNELQRSVMKIRMVPVEQLFRRVPRIVRDLARLEGKAVEVVLEGQDTDLDKSVLDTLAEPLTHLVRNAVDHGLETPAERLASGKTAQGTLRLNAYHQGNHVVIEVSDDGRGIDPQRVITKAIERGVVTAEAASRMSDSEILELVFESGFSTADKITEISGRGVGMDVVKTVLERMKGSVQTRSEPGIGTTFLLKVPLTLAIIRALLFRVGTRLYAIPLSSVVEITRARADEIHKVEGREVLRLRDEVLTLIRLDRLVQHQERTAQTKVFVIVVAFGDRKLGLIVDRLVGEEELVIKALDDHLVATDLVSGASILGDGTVVLILNLAAVVERLGRIRVGSGSSTTWLRGSLDVVVN